MAVEVVEGDCMLIVGNVSTRFTPNRTERFKAVQIELGGRYPAIVGDARQVADELQSWIEDTGIDGFNLSRTVVPESYTDFVDLVIPELQERGLYKTAYEPGTLRHELFGEGARLPERHAAQAFRPQAGQHGADSAGASSSSPSPLTERLSA